MSTNTNNCLLQKKVAEIHYGLTQPDSLPELVTDKRKATSCKSKSVMESAIQCGHFGVIILQ
jgi:hypothetical protein